MSTSEPTPCSAPSKALYVLQRMRADIVSGRLAPAQKLAFRMLTAQYRVGVAPIREALSQLVGGGLVILESQRGFRVAPMSREDLADVAATRSHIEIYALGLSIDRGGDAWRAQVRRAVDDYVRIAVKAGDQRLINEHWQDIHRSVHFAVIGACGSPTLLEFCGRIYDRFDRYRRMVPTQSAFAMTESDHKGLGELALAGEKEKAQALLKRHIEDNAELVIANFSPRTANAPPATSRTTPRTRRPAQRAARVPG